MLGQIFDTLLGVLLMFAVLGIVNSVLVEAVPRILQILPGSRTRGELLKLAIENMFGGPAKDTSQTVTRLSTDLYAHPLIRALGSSAKRLPSYIAPATFATALIDILDKRGNAIAKMLLAEAAVDTERLTTAVSELPPAGDASTPRPLARLSARLNNDIKASTRNDGSVDIIKLAGLSFCWPSALGIVSDAMSSKSDEDNLDTLLKTFDLLPAAWLKDLPPLTTELNNAFQTDFFSGSTDVASNYDKAKLHAKLDQYVQAIQQWESNSCQVTRSATNTLDGIKCLIDSLPDEVKSLRNGLQAIYARMNPAVNAAAADVEMFYTGVENWFGEVTDRVAGWYKRNARVWGVVCAFILCVFANADVIYVVRALSSDAVLRARVAQAAIKTVTDYEASVKANAQSKAGQVTNTKAQALTPASKAVASAASGTAAQAGKPKLGRATSASAASTTAASTGAASSSTGAAAGAAAVANAAPLPILGGGVSSECAELNAKVSSNEGWSASQVTALVKCEQETAAVAFTYLENSALPIGWSVARQNLVFAGYYANADTAPTWGARMFGVLSSGAFWLWLSGVVISSLAVTLGGEYWFNLLEEVVRLSGPPPTKPDKKV
ncbi:hypothetical protein [Paraburkholderia sp. RL17-337-BIB-A]|uniref:hypothetical protein n=1 Tax=Paraburkholderia sp. RL17-337-BIB-A TaxID=3031636 RepID=UPI0038BCB1CA